ncbi:MAG: OsmC family protein [Actinomycetia bacterium]|nr:OsmC family protein [Actinomycetes bacterium]
MANDEDRSEVEEPEVSGGTGPGHRRVSLRRTALGEYELTNVRGGSIRIGAGESSDFTPVELLLGALAGCSAVDVDHLTSRRAEPLDFEAAAEGEKVRSEEDGNLMTDLEVTFRVRFPEGDEGDEARTMLTKAIAMSHDRLCTVSRTVQRGTPVTMREG